MDQTVTRSKRQYAHVQNAAAQRLARSFAGAKGAPMPKFIEPALATLHPRPPRGEQWVHEVKYDGYRFQSHVRQGQVRFFTRRGHDWTTKVGNLAAPVGALKTYAAILDGEVVVQGINGSTDFHELERELARKDGAQRLVFYVFDLLYLDGFDLRDAVLEQRKEVLSQLLAQSGSAAPLIFSEHTKMDGGEMWKHACKIGLEGVVSKRRRCSRETHWLERPPI